MIACWMIYRRDGYGTTKLASFADWSEISKLLQIDERTVDMDRRGGFNFLGQHASCSGILTDFLFTSTTPNCLSISSGQFNELALRILAYLCIPRKHVRNLTQSDKHERLAGTAGSDRRRRASRNQYGVLPYQRKRNRSFVPCHLGLSLLVLVLKNCCQSEELATFIRLHVKHIVIIPRLTRRVLGALSGYLSRNDDEMDVEPILFPGDDFVWTLRWLDRPRYL